MKIYLASTMGQVEALQIQLFASLSTRQSFSIAPLDALNSICVCVFLPV